MKRTFHIRHSRLVYVVLTLVGLVAGYEHASALSWIHNQYPILPACTRFEHQLGIYGFDDIDFSIFAVGSDDALSARAVKDWSAVYHDTVGQVIEEDLGARIGGQNSPLRRYNDPPTCTADNYADFLPPQQLLQSLATSLPTWSDAGNATALTQMDLGLVLLEYLRMYECALLERLALLPAYAASEEAERQVAFFGISYIDLFTSVSDITHAVNEDRQLIHEELADARLTLHRTLELVSGYGRMRPMYEEVNCVQQASLDIRNGIALAADAASCLPRVWNARDPLRDFR